MTMRDDDIAIIGMAGLYPQADDVDVFWSNVLAGKDCVTESTDSWLGDSSILDPDSDDPLKIYTRKGGFLGDLSRFDPRQFGTMPMSITGGQPDQFLALKVAHDALVDAGYAPGKFDGTGTGVILGHAVHAHRGNTNGIQQVWSDAQTRNLLGILFPDLPDDRIDSAMRLMQSKMPKLTPEAIPGLVPNILTGRIANRFDLMGPNYIIDAACSSSIIAVDLAISELRLGRADMMLAGGVNTTTSPLVFGVFCSVDALSRNGRIRPFDRNANGTVLGEGAGMLVLKRLKDALAADDKIYAVIKGVGQSSDGKSSGLMAPRLEGEVLAVRRAYANTQIDPATIGLIEAHGTGIPLGDRTEVDALRTVFGARNGALPSIPIGSVKSMIGHCIPASGSAGIIKMALALGQKIIPPTLCDEVNSAIGLDSTPFYLATEARPWVHSAATPRRAAINAFGFGGINAHMILEESPVGRQMDPTSAFLPKMASRVNPVGLNLPQNSEHVFVFAQASRSEIIAALEVFSVQTSASDFAEQASQTWALAENHPGPSRLSIVAADAADLTKKIATTRTKLESLTSDSLQTRNGIYYEDAPLGGKMAFLFPGEMGQYPNMMKDAAMAFPIVRDWFDFIASLTEGKREVGLKDVVFPPDTLVDATGQTLLDELIHRVDYGSEMVFAADQAVFALLKMLGLKPDAMLGHSTGENAALVASGRLVMDRATIGRMIAKMNVIFAEVEANGVVPSGVLLNVAVLERPGLQKILDLHPDVHFTMDNCPNQAILFGQKDQIESVQSQAVAAGAVCTLLPISWGYHTHFVAPMATAFGQLFEGVSLTKSDVSLYSCSTAKPFPATRDAFQKTSIAQYTTQVRFTDAVNQLYADGCRVFVECGPNAVLTAFVRDILGNRRHLAVSADNRRRGMLAQLRHMVAQLFAAGIKMDVRDVLMPQEDPVQTRRRLTREKQRTAPKLASDLPFVTLDEAEISTLRGLLLVATPPVSALPTAEIIPSVVAAEQPELRTAPGQVNASVAVQDHLGLMTHFLHGQDRVTRQWLSAPGVVTGAVEGDKRSSRQPNRQTQIEVLDLARSFQVPFDFSAFLMRGTPSLEKIMAHLTPVEQAEAVEVANRQGHKTAWQDWSLSRLAVKRAAGTLVANVTGIRPLDSLMGIAKRDGGAPYIEVANMSHPVPGISISHSQASGVGAAAASGWQMGIDYELPSRIRDPESFLETILSDEERDRLGLIQDRQHATIVWAAKEATAKALGIGIQGRPQSFIMTGIDLTRGNMRLSFGHHTVDAQVRQIGDAICVVAYAQGLGEHRNL